MPMIGFGTSGMDPEDTYDAVRTAISVGFRHFDCAPIYKNQQEVGEAINDAIAEGEVTREELWITSKLWNDQHRYNDVEPALEDILDEMDFDYVDLFLIHWPVAHERGVDMPESEEDYLSFAEAPLEDTWTGMEDCLEEGTTKHIGVSNFNIECLQLLIDDAMMPPEVNQVEMHPYLPQQTLYDYCRSNKILMTAYAPLGSPGRSIDRKHPNEPILLGEPAIETIAEKHGCTTAQALLAWSLTRKVSVIPQSTSEDHMIKNLAAADYKLDRADLRELIILPKFRYFKGEEFTIHGSPYKLTDIWEY